METKFYYSGERDCPSLLVQTDLDALTPPAVRTRRPHSQVTRRTRSAVEVFEAERLHALEEKLLAGLTESPLLVLADCPLLADETLLLVLLLALIRL